MKDDVENRVDVGFDPSVALHQCMHLAWRLDLIQQGVPLFGCCPPISGALHFNQCDTRQITLPVVWIQISDRPRIADHIHRAGFDQPMPTRCFCHTGQAIFRLLVCSRIGEEGWTSSCNVIWFAFNAST